MAVYDFTSTPNPFISDTKWIGDGICDDETKYQSVQDVIEVGKLSLTKVAWLMPKPSDLTEFHNQNKQNKKIRENNKMKHVKVKN